MRILFYLDEGRSCLVIPLSSSYFLLLIICLSEELDVNSPLLLQWRGAAQEFSRRFESKSSQGSGFRRSYVVIWILLFHSGLLQGNLLWLFSPLTSEKPVQSSRKQHLAPRLQPLAKTGSAFCLSCDDYGPSSRLEGDENVVVACRGRSQHLSKERGLVAVPFVMSQRAHFQREWEYGPSKRTEKIKREGLSQQTIFGGVHWQDNNHFFQLLYFYFVCVF